MPQTSCIAERQGSSPHTRGARGARRRAPRLSGDHPRIRGEHPVAGVDAHVGDGSSPHTRGAPRCSCAALLRSGIIPAYAGSTATTAALSCTTRGSSPHTRGAPEIFGVWQNRRRIIPAYAGSTGRRGTGRMTPPDHPRIRGEHRQGDAGRAGGGGSSPHTRGARRRAHDCRGRAGIIPAYAGSTHVA